MKCLVCGAEMRLAVVEPHGSSAAQGFEYRTFRCEKCGDMERRFVFDPRTSIDLAAVGHC
jgi:DNA-directed RNA polymerase subunit RPC12/RpoP